jgi:protein gp37
MYPMGKHSAIEWTDHTFNPWWGCVKVSPACANCYAETWSRRVGLRLWGKHADRRFFSDEHWRQPILWEREAKKEQLRRRVFCASMADIFEARQDLDPWRIRLWDLIISTPNLDWLLLTKRPENVQAIVPWGLSWPSNVWLGVTVENRDYATERIPHLLRAPALVRFLSCEPLLGPIDLSAWLSGIDWVILGGESGRQARPVDPSWVCDLRDQVVNAGGAFYFKQWGEWRPAAEGFERVGKKSAGRILDGHVWDEIPQTAGKGLRVPI